MDEHALHVWNVLEVVKERNVAEQRDRMDLYHSVGLLQGVAPVLATIEQHKAWIINANALMTRLLEELDRHAV